MKIRLLITLLATMLTCAHPAVQSNQRPSALVIIHANVTDDLSDQPLRDATIIVRDGKIEDIVSGSTSVPAGATVIDLKGR